MALQFECEMSGVAFERAAVFKTAPKFVATG